MSAVNAVYSLASDAFRVRCKRQLRDNGVLVLQEFVPSLILQEMKRQSRENGAQAYFCDQRHSVYLGPSDPDFPSDHPRNRTVVSSKGCICDDDVQADSPLRALYYDEAFRDFVKAVTGEREVHPYADALSSINVHYAKRGQELGWHFDNSSFAITLLIEKPSAGSVFEYVRDLRDADAGDMNYEGVRAVLDGEVELQRLEMEPGTLVLFRGRNSLHRVTPNESDETRVLAVLAYN